MTARSPEPTSTTTGCSCSDLPVRAPRTHSPLRFAGCCVHTPFYSDGEGPLSLADLTGSSPSVGLSFLISKWKADICLLGG